MEVVKITPRGYCHGVVHALNLVSEAIGNDVLKKPIYILGQIVHNQNVTDAFNKAGVITLDGTNRREILNKVDTGTVIITAHGIDQNLIVEAKTRGLDVVDATCKDVYKTHDIIKEKLKTDFDVIYIGKKNHPEPEGVLAINPEKIHLVSNKDDILNLEVSNSKICITNQTTMSLWDTKDLMEAAKTKFPSIEIINEICLATQQRQEAVLEMAKLADITLVVGDPKSNNTNKLVEISEKLAKTKAYRVSSLKDLEINWLLEDDVNKVAVTSGASTPTLITKQVVEFIEKFDKEDSSTHNTQIPLELSRIIPRVKK